MEIVRFIEELRSTVQETRRMYKHRSIPPHLLARIARAVIHPIARLTADGIMAYPWDWKEEPVTATPEFTIFVEPDPKAFKIISSLDIFRANAGKWREAVLIGLTEEASKSKEARGGWQFAFITDDKTAHVLKVVFNPEEKIRALVGDGPLVAAARAPISHLWLPVERSIETFDRSDPRYKQHSLI